ncbi:MAG TPA: hydrogenase maturation protease, partial [Candidatus Marinimicrobia bacterium]|nr:hydrogenase maturation protease [Candidatus Neomarinimicrobiota bacterium]
TKHVLIIDAAKMGESPGTVKVFDAEDANLTIKTDHLSIHGISLAETMNIAKRIGFYPDTVTIMGIEPERLTINTGLSDSVANAIPTAITKLIEFQSTINPN